MVKPEPVCGISVVKRENAAVFTAAFSMNEMCGQKRCTLSKALQRNRISILEAFQSNNFCNGFYCLTPKDEFHDFLGLYPVIRDTLRNVSLVITLVVIVSLGSLIPG